MRVDPDLLRTKPRSRFARWQLFARADAIVDEYLEAQAVADLKRQLGG